VIPTNTKFSVSAWANTIDHRGLIKRQEGLLQRTCKTASELRGTPQAPIKTLA